MPSNFLVTRILLKGVRQLLQCVHDPAPILELTICHQSREKVVRYGIIVVLMFCHVPSSVLNVKPCVVFYPALLVRSSREILPPRKVKIHKKATMEIEPSLGRGASEDRVVQGMYRPDDW